MKIPGMKNLIPGTRNKQKACGYRGITGIAGIPGCHAPRAQHTPAPRHAHACSRARSLVYTRNTRNTRNKSVIPKDSFIPGTRNEQITTRNKLMSRNLRADMPHTVAFIDEMREAFGTEGVNSAIKAGMNGQPTFYARENGHEIGTKRVGGVAVPATVYEPLEAIQARMKRRGG